MTAGRKRELLPASVTLARRSLAAPRQAAGGFALGSDSPAIEAGLGTGTGGRTGPGRRPAGGDGHGADQRDLADQRPVRDRRDLVPRLPVPVVATSPGASRTFTTAGVESMAVDQVLAGAGQSTQLETAVGAGYTPVTPVRILDTRNGTGVAAGAVPAGGNLILPFPGAGSVPAAQISAVNLNVTVAHPAKGGSLTVFPSGQSLPVASDVNFAAGQTVANLVTVAPGSTGIEFHNGSGGTIQVIADLDGYYGPGGGGLTPVSPLRVLDTRAGTGGRRRRWPPGRRWPRTCPGRCPQTPPRPC